MSSKLATRSGSGCGGSSFLRIDGGGGLGGAGLFGGGPCLCCRCISSYSLFSNSICAACSRLCVAGEGGAGLGGGGLFGPPAGEGAETMCGPEGGLVGGGG
jgi:hypothetical protein